MTEDAATSKSDRQAMMQSMMEHCFGGMDANEKKEMVATMMGKMTEGLDMKEMMPKMMMGMMSGGAGDGPGEMHEKMSKIMQGGPQEHMAQMPEMMLKMMMPHCIGMMLPGIELEKRGEAAAAIIAAIVEKGTTGMSQEQIKAFLDTLRGILNPK